MSIKTGPIATLLWFSLLAANASAAEPGIWDCRTKFGLCRYLDVQTGQELIPARFEQAMPFSEGLAAVSIEGRFGHIDERGTVVIAPRFDLAGDFTHGLAEILVGDKTGVINRKGEIIVPPMFARAIPLTSDVIVAAQGTWTPSGFERARTLPPFERLAWLGTAGLYHVSGRWISAPDLRDVKAFDKEGRFVWASNRNSILYGLLSATGEWVVAPQYENPSPLIDGRAVVRKDVTDHPLSGAVDAAGQIAVPLRRWFLSNWKNGFGEARESNAYKSKQALLDRDGNIIGGRYFDNVEPPEQGEIATVLLDGRWVGMDRAGNIVSNPNNGRVIFSCPGGMQAISIDGKTQIVDASGRPTTPYLFEKLSQRQTCEQPLQVKLNGLWSFVSAEGRLLADPPSFKEIRGFHFNDGYAAVSDGRKWGILDTSGRYVLPMKYDHYLGHRDGWFHLSLDGRQFWLNEAGEERSDPIIKRTSFIDCGHDLRIIERDGLWGIADANGTDVIAPRYRAIHCFMKGVAWAAIDDRHQWCALGPDGVIRDTPVCQTEYPLAVPSPGLSDDERFENNVQFTRDVFEYTMGRREKPPEPVRGKTR